MGSYDPKTNTVFYGTSNPGPWNAAVRSTGTSDFGKLTNAGSSATLALDADTGKIKWELQSTPAEAWDYDGVNELVLADITIDGQKTPVMMKADRDGFFFVANRDTGKLISAKPFVPVNWAKGYDEETGRPVEDPAKRPRLDYKATDICPSWMGGKNWQPMSFNPGTGLIYVTTNNMCQDMQGAEVNYRRGAFYLGNDFAVNPGHGDHLGQLLALDPATQKPAWTMDLPLPWNGGTMTTAGNLVFFGDINGMFHALDAKTGKPLWEMNVGSGVGAGPMTFSVDGKQYVAILVGRAEFASCVHGRGRQEDLRGYTGRRNAVRVLAVVTPFDLKARRHAWSIAAGLLCLMVAGLSLIRSAQAQEEPAPFRLCADPDNLPFSSTSEATPGFYIELGRDIAQALGRKFQPVWVPTYYTKRQVRLKMLAGQCDGFAGVPDDASFMGPRLIFSRPIVQLGYALVAPPALGVNAVADLRGHRVAVQWSSPPQDLLAAENDVQTVTVLSPEEAMQDLRDNKVDAAFIWGATAGWLNTTVMHGAYRIVPVAGDHMQWSAAVAFPRDRTALRDDVDRALTGLGTSINALAAKYGFPAAPGMAANVAEAATDVGTAQPQPQP